MSLLYPFWFHRNIFLQHDEKMRIRALRAMEARAEADVERDRALELTLEVLRRRQADKRRGMGRAQSAPGAVPTRVVSTAHFQLRGGQQVPLWSLLCHVINH